MHICAKNIEQFNLILQTLQKKTFIEYKSNKKRYAFQMSVINIKYLQMLTHFHKTYFPK